MSTVTPPPPPTAPLATNGLVNAAALVLKAPPLVLQSMHLGQALQATITAQPAPTQIQVQTLLGAMTLQTGMNLPRGAVLTLELTSQSPPTFQISTLNGKPVAQGQIQPQGHIQTQGQGNITQATAPVPSQPLAPGQTISATLLRPAAAAPPPASTSAPSQAGSPTQAAPPSAPQSTAPAAPNQSTVQATPPGAAQPTTGAAAGAARAGITPSAPTAPTASTPLTTSPAVTGTLTPGTSTQATTLPTGTRFSATVQRIEAPNASVATPTPNAGAKSLALGQVMTGNVTGRTTGGQPIAQTPAATFALGSPGATADVGEGTKITFRLDSQLSPATTPGAALRAPGTTHDLINAKSWDSLGDALKALVGADPGRLTHLAQTALPQPGGKMSAQMLFFLSALKGGDVKGLFGDSAMRVIDKERPGLLSRLSTDFQTMARLADEPQQGDWRLALIPLWTGEHLEQLRFFWRKNEAEEGEEAADDTRFVFDLEFSQLGHMQIDGLVKAKRKHLDLIIRTDEPLPPEMRTGIAEIFEDARDTLGMGGQVAFQAAPGNFVTVPSTEPSQMTAHASSGLMA